MRRFDGVRVSLGRAVAGFAALNVRLIGKGELRVCGLIELDHFVFVAIAATRGSCEVAGGSVEIGCVARNGRTVEGLGLLLGEGSGGCRRDQSGEEKQPT